MYFRKIYYIGTIWFDFLATCHYTILFVLLYNYDIPLKVYLNCDLMTINNLQKMQQQVYKNKRWTELVTYDLWDNETTKTQQSSQVGPAMEKSWIMNKTQSWEDQWGWLSQECWVLCLQTTQKQAAIPCTIYWLVVWVRQMSREVMQGLSRKGPHKKNSSWLALPDMQRIRKQDTHTHTYIHVCLSLWLSASVALSAERQLWNQKMFYGPGFNIRMVRDFISRDFSGSDMPDSMPAVSGS